MKPQFQKSRISTLLLMNGAFGDLWVLALSPEKRRKDGARSVEAGWPEFIFAVTRRRESSCSGWQGHLQGLRGSVGGLPARPASGKGCYWAV